MSEEEYDMFCTHCGQRLAKDAAFCPSCGTSVSDMMGGAETNNNTANTYAGRPAPNMDSRLKILSVIFAISAALMLFYGIYELINVDSIINTYTSDPSWQTLVDMVVDAGYTEQWLIDTMKTAIIGMSVAYIIGGAFLATAAVCGFTKKGWAIGLICCIFATILTSVTVLGLIVGIIMTYLYHTTKPSFS